MSSQQTQDVWDSWAVYNHSGPAVSATYFLCKHAYMFATTDPFLCTQTLYCVSADFTQ